MAKLVVFGTGDIACLAEFYFTTDSDHEVVAFTVDADYRRSENFMDRPLVPFSDVTRLYPPSAFKMFIAVGYRNMNRVRAAKYAEARARGYELVSYVSSRCTFLTRIPVGDNCFILEDNTVQPFVTIGSNVTVWSGNHIGHHAVIGDHSFIASHVVVSGRVRIGEGCFIGVNATLRDGIVISDGTLVGAGALLMKSTQPGSVYLGPRAERFARSSEQIDI
jgi:sugar O-acyltransferase (sialic acid O-acetyltransferase NeuD family)